MQVGRQGRSARATMRVGPAASDEAPMPAQDRRRRDHEQVPAGLGPARDSDPRARHGHGCRSGDGEPGGGAPRAVCARPGSQHPWTDPASHAGRSTPRTDRTARTRTHQASTAAATAFRRNRRSPTRTQFPAPTASRVASSRLWAAKPARSATGGCSRRRDTMQRLSTLDTCSSRSTRRSTPCTAAACWCWTRRRHPSRSPSSV